MILLNLNTMKTTKKEQTKFGNKTIVKSNNLTIKLKFKIKLKIKMKKEPKLLTTYKIYSMIKILIFDFFHINNSLKN